LRALVIGGSGQVGGAIAAALAAAGHEVVATWRSVEFPDLVHCDLADQSEVEQIVAEARPEAVFCPAGATWVDGCESDPAWARDANVEGPLVAARAAPDVPFVYFSSEYVFDGADGPYHEDAVPAPLSEYGRTKLAGEDALRVGFPKSLIIRTGWVFGPERQGKNFVYQLAKKLRAGERMRVPSDQWGTPTFAPDLARISVELVARGATGMFHVAGPDCCAREAFAREACEVLDLDAGLLDPVTTAELQQAAARPLKAGLFCDGLTRAMIEPPRATRAGLETMRAEMTSP
jgi:dTDP-4-dehydrorhamnose reductase